MIPYRRRAVDKAFSSASHLIATFSMCFHSSELGSAHKKSVCRWQTLYQSDPGGILTPDRWSRNPVLYTAELRSHFLAE